MFCKKIGLPVSLGELGIKNIGDDQLLEAAKEACKKEDTMRNRPFEVTSQDVLAATKTADLLSKEL